jgi:hypothetical protein
MARREENHRAKHSKKRTSLKLQSSRETQQEKNIAEAASQRRKSELTIQEA